MASSSCSSAPGCTRFALSVESWSCSSKKSSDAAVWRAFSSTTRCPWDRWLSVRTNFRRDSSHCCCSITFSLRLRSSASAAAASSAARTCASHFFLPIPKIPTVVPSTSSCRRSRRTRRELSVSGVSASHSIAYPVYQGRRNAGEPPYFCGQNRSMVRHMPFMRHAPGGILYNKWNT